MSNFTYTYTDPNTDPVSATRFHAADTNIAPGFVVWSDQELLFCLSLVGGKPELAAAKALRAAASDASKLAVITRLGQLGNDETKLPGELRAMADALELASLQTPVVNSPPQTWVPANSAANVRGNMDPW